MKRHKIIFIIAVVSMGLVGVAIFGYNYYKKNLAPVLTIGDVKISRTEYNEFIAQAKKEKLEENNAKNQLIDSQKKIQAAKKLGISISDSDRIAVLTSRYGFFEIKKTNNWQKLNVEAGAIDSKVAFMVKGGYKGALFEFPFSRNFDALDPKSAGPDFGNIEKIAEDKKYALEQATLYRSKIINNTISSKQAVEEIFKNERLILGSSGNKSIEFVIDETGYEAVDTANGSYIGRLFIDTVKTMKPGDVSGISVKKMSLSYYDKNESKEPKEVAYYFVKLSDSIKPKPTIKAEFLKEIIGIKVQSNV